MDDGKIYITISDKRGNGVENQQEYPELQQKNDDEKFDEYVRYSFYSFIKSKASQIVNYSVSNIGNFTGDYNTQRQVQLATQIGGAIGGIATATATLGAIGGIIAIASLGITTALEHRTNIAQNEKQNHEINQLREISGLNALTNGSR